MKIIFKFVHVVFVITSFFFLQSCDKASDPVKGAYQSGVLIVNEGAFGSANGDITYYNPSLDVIEQNVFKKVNSAFAGDVLQSISVEGDDGYLVLNGSSKIEIVDINTMKRKSTFTNVKLNSPRYLNVINGKAYITVWGPFDANFALVDSYVLVVDIKTLAIVATIDTSEGVENILYNGKYLFVSKNGFTGSNELSVIDPSANELVSTTILPGEPQGMVVDVNGKLWTITTGASSKLIRISSTTFGIEQIIEVGANAGSDLALSADKKNLIYSLGNSIYKMSISASTKPTNPLFIATDVVNLSALDVDPKTDIIHVGDALNFSSAGNVYLYNADGSFKRKVEAGIVPTCFIFR